MFPGRFRRKQQMMKVEGCFPLIKQQMMKVEVEGSGSGSRSRSSKRSSSLAALPKDLTGPPQLGVPYLLCPVDDDDESSLKLKSKLWDVNNEDREFLPKVSYPLPAVANADDDDESSLKLKLKLWDVTNIEHREFLPKVSYPLPAVVANAADDEVKEGAIWYACGRKSGWMVAVYPSKDYKIKLVNIFINHPPEAKVIINIPPLEPYDFFFPYEADILSDTLDHIAEQGPFSFAKFVLHGDPDPASGDKFILVAIFSKFLSSGTVQAAVFSPSSSSDSWIPVVHEVPWLDALIHGDQLWVVDKWRALYCFPLLKSLRLREVVLDHASSKYSSPGLYCFPVESLRLQEVVLDHHASSKYSFRGFNCGNPRERNYDMIYLVDWDDDDDDDPNKKYVVVRKGYPTRVNSGYFRVYELSHTGTSAKELKDLGNRALFVGDNASFFVPLYDDKKAAANPGLKPNCIYFSDNFCSRNFGLRFDLDEGEIVPVRVGVSDPFPMDVGAFDLKASEFIDLPVPATIDDPTTRQASCRLPVPVPQWIYS